MKRRSRTHVFCGEAGVETSSEARDTALAGLQPLGSHSQRRVNCQHHTSSRSAPSSVATDACEMFRRAWIHYLPRYCFVVFVLFLFPS